jgi:hypothetical protein
MCQQKNKNNCPKLLVQEHILQRDFVCYENRHKGYVTNMYWLESKMLACKWEQVKTV